MVSLSAIVNDLMPSQVEDEKKIPSSSGEDVATVFVEAISQSPEGSVSVPVVSRVLDMPYSTAQKSLRRILNFYPYNFKPVHLLQYWDSELQQRGCLQDIIFMQDVAPPHIDRRVTVIAKTAFHRFTGDQPSFSNSIASSFAGYHPLRLLVVGFPEGQYLP
ncbi:hypothetical protein AVEN_181533-1 [Araneus ventricosus]|uniref:Uncharacterized protein n=1 Tax=Araneus ventricosus TaxID=182803 RepID=A0A4Y2JDM9_ARAVE|nr:hypothetical protein AVEN_181533-1 [Araneus ventricosus]